MGSVVLCVTGCEAMYADMGHFGKNPVRVSWILVVYPSLILNYLGQVTTSEIPLKLTLPGQPAIAKPSRCCQSIL